MREVKEESNNTITNEKFNFNFNNYKHIYIPEAKYLLLLTDQTIDFDPAKLCSDLKWISYEELKNNPHPRIEYIINYINIYQV